jgi:hypothetical protein
MGKLGTLPVFLNAFFSRKLRDTHLLDDPPLHCHTQAMTKPRTELIALTN